MGELNESKEMKIAVAGTGYVGLSIATLLAQKNTVVAVDVVPEKVEKINRRESPIQDEYIEKYFAEKALDLVATLDGRAAYRDADYVVIAAPTNYDPKKNFFDTSHVEEVISLVLEVNPDAVMVIKSTVPVGYTKHVREKFSYRERMADGSFRVVVPRIIFAPEFLRESKALYDNLYPSRIIVGFDEMPASPSVMPTSENVMPASENVMPAKAGISLSEAAHTFAVLIKEGALKEDVPVLFMGSTEAEDKMIVETIREVTDKPIVVDANQGWKDRSQALDEIAWLAEQGVVMVEQPLPIDRLDDTAWLTERSPLPIFADESVQRLKDIPSLVGAFNGINIKLMKCTGMREAWKMLTLARSLGMKVMVGCMTETSCAVSAAAQLSPAVDFADLDGNLLISNDRFRGVQVISGKLTLPDAPGIGISLI